MKTTEAINTNPSCRLAEERWHNVIREEHTKKRIDELRTNLIHLQMPGEIELRKGTYRDTVDITAGYGDTTWSTGKTMEVNRNTWILTTGARKSIDTPLTDITGGYELMTTKKVEKEKTAEEVRQDFMESSKKALDDAVQQIIDYILNLGRPSDIPKEEWNADEYSDRVLELAIEAQGQWETEDKRKLEELIARHKLHEQEAQELKKLRQEFERIYRDACLTRMENINRESIPGVLGVDRLKIDEVHRLLEIYREEVPLYRQRVEAAITAKQAEDRATKEEQTRSYSEAVGQDPLTKLGIAFAEIAIEKLGTEKAIELIRGELEANYGIGKRLKAIASRLPGVKNPALNQLLNLRRAGDLRKALQSALSHLGYQEPQEETIEEAAETPAKPEPAEPKNKSKQSEPATNKPATLDDLRAKFNRKGK